MTTDFFRTSGALSTTSTSQVLSRPSLLLDFCNSERLDSRITFTRNSIATRVNSLGLIETVAANKPRFDYDPITGVSKGLLIEEQRTNIAASSVYTANTNGWTNGVAAGGIGAVAAASINSPAGTTDGVFNISGLNGSSYVGLFSTVTASANARTGSVFVRNNGGVKFQIRLVFQTGGTFVSYGTEYDFNTTAFQDGIGATTAPTSRSVTNVGNGWLRISITGSDNGTGNTLASLQFWGTATTTNYNYLMWGAQIEEASGGASASFSTSYIPTTTTALTRSADVASVNTLSPWYNATAGTIYAEVQRPSSASNNGAMVGVNDGTVNNRLQTRIDGATTNTNFIVLASVVNYANNGTFISGGVNKAALTYETNNVNSASNGVAGTTDTSEVIPTGLTKLDLGQVVGAGSLNGWLRRAAYYPRRLSNAEFQTLTK